MTENAYTPTRVGQLLLDPDGPYIWAVKSPKRLIRLFGPGNSAEATLTKAAVPPEWRIIDADDLARSLVTKTGSPTELGRRCLREPLQGSATNATNATKATDKP